jgi:hypothetical protein
MKNSQNIFLQPASDSGIHTAGMNGALATKVNDRPQTRLNGVMALALSNYCKDNDTGASRALRLGLKLIIPNRYFEAARKKLHNKKK